MFAIVRGLPNVDFHVNSQVVDLPNAVVEFTVDREVFGPITSYLWDFGDGSTSTDVNPVINTARRYLRRDIDHLQCRWMYARHLLADVHQSQQNRPHIRPNGFHAQRDGLNDYFEVFTTLITTFHIDIFDRW